MSQISSNAFGEPDAPQHAPGVMAAAIGEDKAPSGQSPNGRLKLLIGTSAEQIDVVNIGEECFGIDAMNRHQSAERGAIALVIGLLQMPRLVRRKLHGSRDIVAHACVDLSEQLAVGPVERVVEIEDPSVDMAKVRCWFRHIWRFFHGIRAAMIACQYREIGLNALSQVF